MAKTKVVNKSKTRRKRRNYGAAAKPPARRTRRRNPAPRRTRRRNPSPQRRRNPSFGIESVVSMTPAATMGTLLSRWAVRLAGEMQVRDGQAVPGFQHAFAVWITAIFGGNVLSRMTSKAQGDYFKIAALGFGGDLFLRKWFLSDSQWAQNNIYLDGMGSAHRPGAYGRRPGLGQDSQRRTFTDAMGNRYVWTSRGWQLSGASGVGATYTRSPLMGARSSGNMGSLMEQSPLNAPPAHSGGSSFGYS